MKHTKIFAIFLCLCLLLAACGAGKATSDMEISNRYEASSNDAPKEDMITEALKSESPELSATVQPDRKLIKTVSIHAETEHYSQLLTALDEKVLELGGYVESRQSGSYTRSNRWCEMTVRIPADRLAAFQTHVAENANVLSTAEHTQDVTLQYSDTEARIAALETERARLMELLAEAGSLYDILEIESRLSNVTYELERYEVQKRTYDNQIDYATISLQIQEVLTLTPTEDLTVWQRIRTGFADSLRGVGEGLVDAFVWLIVALPYLVIWVPLTALVLWLMGKLRRKVQKKKQSPPSQTP